MSASLSQCLQAIERIEFAADRLGPAWPGHAPILAKCSQFRAMCESCSSNRGYKEVTIAFIGPRNAGKSTVASLFVHSEEKRRRLNIGQASDDSTAKPTWIAPSPPQHFDAENEEFIPCHRSDLEPMEFDYVLLDLPGLNEGAASRRMRASQGLIAAQVKILVVDRPSLESGEISKYLDAANGSPIIPVVTMVRSDDDPADFAAWEKKLRAHLGASNILEHLQIEDWDVEGNTEAIQAEARKRLSERMVQAIAGTTPAALAARQLAPQLRAFLENIAIMARQHLPATAAALEDLNESLIQLPARAVESLLGSERAVACGVRLRLRSVLLERTPIFLFPWRLALSIANLVHGATDRVPLAMLGSLPSMLTAAWAAAKNVQQAREFASEAVAGLRGRVLSAVKDLAGPKLHAVDYALQREVKAGDAVPRTAVTSTAALRGIETLQARSTELFQEVIERFAPSFLIARIVALLGFAIFWSVFGWPVYGLYRDFASAASDVLLQHKPALDAFPSGTLSMLMTSGMLAVIPMGLFLLVTLATLTRQSQVLACTRALRAAHVAEVEKLTKTGMLEVELSEPQIDACRVLLSMGSGAVPPAGGV